MCAHLESKCMLKIAQHRSMYRSGWWVQHGRSYVVTATHMQCMNGDGANGLCHCIGSGGFCSLPWCGYNLVRDMHMF